VIALAAYPVLPDQVVSHWYAAGEPNGFRGKPAGIGLVPLIMVALVALLLFLPRIDPLRKNYAAFRDWYDGFILAFVLFMLAGPVPGHPLEPRVSHQHEPGDAGPRGAPLRVLRVFPQRVEPNWFAGIRTPWTLSSPAVWKKTHVLGGKLFKIAGIVSCAGALVPDLAIWFILVPVLASALATVVYSYYAFRKEEEKT
jgi:uncharacterized membrane protein